MSLILYEIQTVNKQKKSVHSDTNSLLLSYEAVFQANIASRLTSRLTLSSSYEILTFLHVDQCFQILYLGFTVHVGIRKYLMQ